MGMNGYLNYLTHLAQSPNDSQRGLQQAFINETWEDTTLEQTVLEEISHGNFKFAETLVWKNSISKFAVNIVKDERNYRRLMFKDQTHTVERGRYYNFDDNFWLCYDPTSDIEPYTEVSVVRCNNVAKWIDKDNGTIYELPCVLDYEASTPKSRVDKDIITPNNSTLLSIQGNENTIKFTENQRFIFNGRPFKITGYNNYMQTDFITAETPMLFFDIYLDEKHVTDDFENGIADRYQYNYSVNILENPIENIKGFKSKLTAEVKLNNDLIEQSVAWKCNENATIDSNGNYELIGNNGSIAIFTATFGSFASQVSVNIVGDIIIAEQIVCTPEISELKQSRSVSISAMLYKNGVVQADTVDAVVSGADNVNCYTWVNNNDNTFILNNNLRSTLPLNINFTSGNVSKEMSIQLKALF